MYKAFPDALLRKPVVTGGVRVSIPFLEDLLNRAELKAWMEWEPAELEFQPYYWSKRWRYAGMGRQERAQMDTDKAFEQVLGTGQGKDRMWQAALEWRSQVSEGQSHSRLTKTRPRETQPLPPSKPCCTDSSSQLLAGGWKASC